MVTDLLPRMGAMLSDAAQLGAIKLALLTRKMDRNCHGWCGNPV